MLILKNSRKGKMENIPLPLLIFLLFVFVTIFRTKQKLKNLSKSNKNEPKKFPLKLETDKNEKKPGWKNILTEAYEQIQREIKSAREEKQAKYELPEKARKTLKSSTVLWEKEMLFPSPPPIPSKEIKKKKVMPLTQKPEFMPSQELKMVKTDPLSIKRPTIKDLRKAVVWSEILAPPVALRKDQDF
jgi:hypothetical protein